MPDDGNFAEKNQRLSYLLEVYKLYQGHINTMFNYFLLASGLLANAYLQVIQREVILSAFVAFVGALISVLSLLVHIRSREVLDVIERGLRVQEETLFSADNPGFLLTRAKHKHWFR